MRHRKAPSELASAPPPIVSGRWLLAAVGMALVGAAICAWATLCLLFWQGSWQLLYHPTAAVTRTPANLGMSFDPVRFATTDAGELRLTGWWIPAAPAAPFSSYTVLYLHGQNGNMSDTLSALETLHDVGLNVLAFDYRGFGQSQFVHPSEVHWRQDAEWALDYLTGTRHINPHDLVLNGIGLGANLALEIAAAHPELAGVVLESPLQSPVSAIFRDARARMVPAHTLVLDRYDLNQPAANLRIPSLWFLAAPPPEYTAMKEEPAAFDKITAPKTIVWLTASPDRQKDYADAFSRWLDGLPGHNRKGQTAPSASDSPTVSPHP